jgi:hypothetical protein
MATYTWHLGSNAHAAMQLMRYLGTAVRANVTIRMTKRGKYLIRDNDVVLLHLI